MKVLDHKEIDVDDIVQYEGKEHVVTKVWNHGYNQWWFDLKCLTPMVEGLPYFEEPLSCSDDKVKLIRKAEVKK